MYQASADRTQVSRKESLPGATTYQPVRAVLALSVAFDDDAMVQLSAARSVKDTSSIKLPRRGVGGNRQRTVLNKDARKLVLVVGDHRPVLDRGTNVLRWGEAGVGKQHGKWTVTGNVRSPLPRRSLYNVKMTNLVVELALAVDGGVRVALLSTDAANLGTRIGSRTKIRTADA